MNNKLVSYQCSGRIWLTYMMARYINPKVRFPLKHKYSNNKCGANGVEPNMPFFSHAKLNRPLLAGRSVFIYDTKNGKVGVLIREPKDNLVSCYHNKIFGKDRNKFDGTMSEFIRCKSYGIKRIMKFHAKYHQHQAKVGKERIQFFKYEDLNKHTLNTFIKMLEYFEFKDIDYNKAKKVVEAASFEKMQAEERKTVPLKNPDAYKIRRGRIGGYVDYLSQEDIDYINEFIVNYAYFQTNPPYFYNI